MCVTHHANDCCCSPLPGCPGLPDSPHSWVRHGRMQPAATMGWPAWLSGSWDSCVTPRGLGWCKSLHLSPCLLAQPICPQVTSGELRRQQRSFCPQAWDSYGQSSAHPEALPMGALNLSGPSGKLTSPSCPHPGPNLPAPRPICVLLSLLTLGGRFPFPNSTPA